MVFQLAEVPVSNGEFAVVLMRIVSNPDADYIGGFLDVFDAFPVETVYVSGDPNNTLTYNTFLRGVRDEEATTEVLRAGALMDWGGVRADARVPKHPALSAAIPRQFG